MDAPEIGLATKGHGLRARGTSPSISAAARSQGAIEEGYCNACAHPDQSHRTLNRPLADALSAALSSRIKRFHAPAPISGPNCSAGRISSPRGSPVVAGARIWKGLPRGREFGAIA